MEKNGKAVTKIKAGKQKKRTLTQSDDGSSSKKVKKQNIMKDESFALCLTYKKTSEARQTRRLTDFFLHDSDGSPQPVEMFESSNITIRGVILPLEISTDHKEKENGVRCKYFGRVEKWNITCNEADGSPMIRISTKLADYICLEPATSYKKIFNYLMDKASALVAVHKKLSKSYGGNPDTSFNELLAAVVRSMSGNKRFSNDAAIHELVISEGKFIYNQLAGLDETETRFGEIPILVTLRDGINRLEDERKSATLLQDEKTSIQSDVEGEFNVDELPGRMLHDVNLYNSEMKFMSLDPCADIDVNVVFASGRVTIDDGIGFNINDSESSTQQHDPDRMTIFRSNIKAWTIEFDAGMISVLFRTDVAWYRLRKPSKIYAPWYEPVLKSARVAVRIITLLNKQTRVSTLSFIDVIKRLSKLEENDDSYISSKPNDVERCVVNQGKIILRVLETCPNIRNSPFFVSLGSKMKDKSHTRKHAIMQATTTRLVREIWGECTNNVPEEAVDDVESDIEEVKNSELPKPEDGKMEIRWAGEPLYQKVIVGGETVAVGGAVLMEVDETPFIYYVEYMFEGSDHCKMLHGKLLLKGSETVLKNAANERELFLTNECMTMQLKNIKGTVTVEMGSRPWGHQYRKENTIAYKLEREKAKERHQQREYYCKSLYLPQRGGFFSLPSDMGRGSGLCDSCQLKEDEKNKMEVKLNTSKTGFSFNGIGYSFEDFVYVRSTDITEGVLKNRTKDWKSGRNIGLKPFVVCQFLEILVPMPLREAELDPFDVRVRRFYRPEDISQEKAYTSNIQELYYSVDTYVISLKSLQGKCQVRRKNDMPWYDDYQLLDHIFLCEYLYDSSKGSLKQLPANIKKKFSTIKDDLLLRKKKGKRIIESETDSEIVKPDVVPKEWRLATLDIFAGCGGLSYGLEKAGVSATKWAIEYEEPAGQAFRRNHPESTVFVENCNVLLRAIMEKCGDEDECIASTEAAELAAKLDENLKSTLPLPGQVDFINGGPPCQGFSHLNRFPDMPWSKVQCEMILTFLSFADYFRPRYFLLENVKSFVTQRNGQTFQLTLASLLEMGYQVRFGVLEAGAYGIAQSRPRAFIWAAAPGELLLEWPEPMHVFRSWGSNNITLSPSLSYAAVGTTQDGAPFRSMTVRDTIGDLPSVENGESKTKQKYGANPVSWFQKEIRGNMSTLTEHICKEMNELDLIRCKMIPKRSGADWTDLPNEKVMLSGGKSEDMIPHWLQPHIAKKNNRWKGLYGRLDWQGNFPTTLTDPRPMGLVGMCFHPDQDRIVTVREYARSQGFPDSYKFGGNILDKHRQIGNAVPPPLAFALGRKLKEAVDLKKSLQQP